MKNAIDHHQNNEKTERKNLNVLKETFMFVSPLEKMRKIQKYGSIRNFGLYAIPPLKKLLSESNENFPSFSKVK